MTLSSRQFNQDVSRAKKAAKAGPTLITDHGRPAHMLLMFDEYKRTTSRRMKIADLLVMPSLADIELERPPLHNLAQPADFC